MNKRESNLKPRKAKSTDKVDDLPGYLPYPKIEDIYQHDKEEQDIDPEDISKKKAENDNQDTLNEKGFEEDPTGSDLDIPGSELDDEQEKVGNEDEENNYYSLGGENHIDLEEAKGD